MATTDSSAKKAFTETNTFTQPPNGRLTDD
jgi:hypothetical protein